MQVDSTMAVRRVTIDKTEVESINMKLSNEEARELVDTLDYALDLMHDDGDASCQRLFTSIRNLLLKELKKATETEVKSVNVRSST